MFSWSYLSGKYCKKFMKKYIKKELVMSNKDDKYFREIEKCWICGKKYDEGDVRARDHCHVTREFNESAHRNCNINLQLTHEMLATFYNRL